MSNIKLTLIYATGRSRREVCYRHAGLCRKLDCGSCFLGAAVSTQEASDKLINETILKWVTAHE